MKRMKISTKGIPGSEREGMAFLFSILEDDENAAQFHVDEVVHHVSKEIGTGILRGPVAQNTVSLGPGTILRASMDRRHHRGENLDLDVNGESAIRHQPFRRVEINTVFLRGIREISHFQENSSKFPFEKPCSVWKIFAKIQNDLRGATQPFQLFPREKNRTVSSYKCCR